MLRFGNLLCLIVIGVLFVSGQAQTIGQIKRKLIADVSYIDGLAAAKDVLVVNTRAAINVYRMLSGKYQFVAFDNSTDYQRKEVFTNGKWIGFIDYSEVTLIQLFPNNTLSAPVIVQAKAITLLSDDTLIALNSSHVLSYKFSNNQWQLISSFAPGFLPYSGTPAQDIDAKENSIVLKQQLDGVTAISIYKRQPDLSYLKSETFNISGSTSSNILYNDVDTIFYNLIYEQNGNGFEGTINIFSKVNGSWSFTQKINGSNVNGLIAPSSLGWRRVLVNPNAVLFTAHREFESKIKAQGRLLLLTRENGVWQPKLVLYANSYNSQLGDAPAVAVNDYDMFAVLNTLNSNQWNVLGLNACAHVPINVTCDAGAVQVKDCSSAVSLASYYRINNPQCGALDVMQNLTKAAGSSITTSFTFERDFVPSTSCSIEVQCANLNKVVSGSSTTALSTAAAILMVVLLLVF